MTRRMAPKDPKSPPKPRVRKFRSRWDLEQDRVIKLLKGADWTDREVIEAFQRMAILDWEALIALARSVGPFELFTAARYEEFGL